MNTSTTIILMAITVVAVMGQDRGPRSEEFKKVADECKKKVNASDDACMKCVNAVGERILKLVYSDYKYVKGYQMICKEFEHRPSNPEDINEYFKNDMKFMMNRIAPTSRTAQCLMACIKKATGCMNPDNTMNIDNAKKHLEGMKENNKEMYDKMVKILTECKALETPEPDECAAAKKFADCMMTKRDAAGIPSH